MRTTRLAAISMRATVLAAAAVCASCVMPNMEKGDSRPIPIADALRNMNVDLSHLNVIVPSDLLKTPKGGTGVIRDSAVADIKETIANIQCYDMDYTTDPKKPVPKKDLRKRDPLIPVFTGPMQLTVQGQYSLGGTLTLSVTPSAAATATRQTQQQAMFPLTLVSLATLPAFYVGQQTTNIQYVALYKDQADAALGTDQRKRVAEYLTNAIAVATALTDIVDSALSRFDANEDQYCAGRDNKAKTTVAASAAYPQ